MNITREKPDLKPEMDLITGMIVSTEFLEKVKPYLKDLSLLQEPTNRLIVKWVLDFYETNNASPGDLIQDVYVSKKETIQDTQAEKIELILSNLNRNYVEKPEQFSTNYYVDKCQKYLDSQSLVKLAEGIIGSVKTGDLDHAKRLQVNFNRLDKQLSNGVDPIRDKEFANRIFTSIKEGLIKFPYPALDDMLKTNYRGDVMAVAGPAKRGKSFFMSEIGNIAFQQGLNVAVFSWEMDDVVMGTRLFQNLLGVPKIALKDPIRYPVYNKGMIEYQEILPDPLSAHGITEIQEKISTYSKPGELRFFDHHTCGRKVSDVKACVKALEKYEDIKIDVVIMDYAGLMEPESSFKGSAYEGINHIWAETKKLAQDTDTLVILGTQYNRTAVSQDIVTPVEAAGSSRPFDFCSIWISLRQNNNEKKNNVTRLNALGRHDNYSIEDEVVCLQCLELGRPIVDAVWKDEITNYGILFAEEDTVEEKKEKKERKPRKTIVETEKFEEDPKSWIF